CAMPMAPHQLPSLPPPIRVNPTAGANSGLDKTWGQRQEACQLADAIDVDLAILRSLVSRGATNSGIFQNFVAFLLDEKPNALAISIRNAKKDIDCSVRLANETALKVPVLTAAAQKFQTCLAEGKGELTLPHLALSLTDDESQQN
ncbi:NAD(P)-dependent oxidoreductase, partial [Bradyrhizobium sp. 180]|uniref:NAD-binding protein n=1 Tax=Bradyrhizobium sp. 180 TaxID=2782650 RepID=UPI001FFA662B